MHLPVFDDLGFPIVADDLTTTVPGLLLLRRALPAHPPVITPLRRRFGRRPGRTDHRVRSRMNAPLLKTAGLISYRRGRQVSLKGPLMTNVQLLAGHHRDSPRVLLRLRDALRRCCGAVIALGHQSPFPTPVAGLPRAVPGVEGLSAVAAGER